MKLCIFIVLILICSSLHVDLYLIYLITILLCFNAIKWERDKKGYRMKSKEGWRYRKDEGQVGKDGGQGRTMYTPGVKWYMLTSDQRCVTRPQALIQVIRIKLHCRSGSFLINRKKTNLQNERLPFDSLTVCNSFNVQCNSQCTNRV